MSDSRYLSKEFISDFLEKYRDFPCLWKIKSKEYTNKNLKNKAYDELVDLCKTVYPDANRDFVVKKIQSFRGSFRKELKKVEDSKRSGRSADEVHIPTLWYYHLLEFTVDQELPTGSISNINSEDQLHILDENTDEENINTQSTEMLLNDDDNNIQVQATEPTTPKFFLPTQQTSLKKKRKITDRQDEFLKVCIKALTTNDITEYDAIGINVASKLKRMNQTQYIYAESLLNKVLTQGLLGTLTSKSDICEKSSFRQTPLSSYSDYSYVYHTPHDLNTQGTLTSINSLIQPTTNSNERTHGLSDTPAETTSEDSYIWTNENLSNMP